MAHFSGSKALQFEQWMGADGWSRLTHTENCGIVWQKRQFTYCIDGTLTDYKLGREFDVGSWEVWHEKGTAVKHPGTAALIQRILGG